MTQTPGARLQQKLDLGAVLPAIGIYDAFSASIASKYFDAVFLSGYGFTASHYGLPDEGFVTLDDIVGLTERIRFILPSVHIVVDIDDGFGDERACTDAALRLEQAGASAVILEDQARPKRCGHFGGKSVLPVDAYLCRLSALLEARRKLMVVARTDACFEEGLARVQAYAKAGADAVMLEGLSEAAQIGRIRAQIPAEVFLAVNLIRGGKTPPVALSELGRLGANLVIYSTPCLFPAQQALADTMQRMLENDCILDDSHGRIQLADNNQVLVDNRIRAGIKSDN